MPLAVETALERKRAKYARKEEEAMLRARALRAAATFYVFNAAQHKRRREDTESKLRAIRKRARDARDGTPEAPAAPAPADGLDGAAPARGCAESGAGLSAIAQASTSAAPLTPTAGACVDAPVDTAPTAKAVAPRAQQPPPPTPPPSALLPPLARARLPASAPPEATEKDARDDSCARPPQLATGAFAADAPAAVNAAKLGSALDDRLPPDPLAFPDQQHYDSAIGGELGTRVLGVTGIDIAAAACAPRAAGATCAAGAADAGGSGALARSAPARDSSVLALQLFAPDARGCTVACTGVRALAVGEPGAGDAGNCDVNAQARLLDRCAPGVDGARCGVALRPGDVVDVTARGGELLDGAAMLIPPSIAHPRREGRALCAHSTHEPIAKRVRLDASVAARMSPAEQLVVAPAMLFDLAPFGLATNADKMDRFALALRAEVARHEPEAWERRWIESLLRAQQLVSCGPPGTGMTHPLALAILACVHGAHSAKLQPLRIGIYAVKGSAVLALLTRVNNLRAARDAAAARTGDGSSTCNGLAAPIRVCQLVRKASALRPEQLDAWRHLASPGSSVTVRHGVLGVGAPSCAASLVCAQPVDEVPPGKERMYTVRTTRDTDGEGRAVEVRACDLDDCVEELLLSPTDSAIAYMNDPIASCIVGFTALQGAEVFSLSHSQAGAAAAQSARAQPPVFDLLIIDAASQMPHVLPLARTDGGSRFVIMSDEQEQQTSSEALPLTGVGELGAVGVAAQRADTDAVTSDRPRAASACAQLNETDRVAHSLIEFATYHENALAQPCASCGTSGRCAPQCVTLRSLGSADGAGSLQPAGAGDAGARLGAGQGADGTLAEENAAIACMLVHEASVMAGVEGDDALNGGLHARIAEAAIADRATEPLGAVVPTPTNELHRADTEPLGAVVPTPTNELHRADTEPLGAVVPTPTNELHRADTEPLGAVVPTPTNELHRADTEPLGAVVPTPTNELHRADTEHLGAVVPTPTNELHRADSEIAPQRAQQCGVKRAPATAGLDGVHVDTAEKQHESERDMATLCVAPTAHTLEGTQLTAARAKALRGKRVVHEDEDEEIALQPAQQRGVKHALATAGLEGMQLSRKALAAARANKLRGKRVVHEDEDEDDQAIGSNDDRRVTLPPDCGLDDDDDSEATQHFDYLRGGLSAIGLGPLSDGQPSPISPQTLAAPPASAPPTSAPPTSRLHAASGCGGDEAAARARLPNDDDGVPEGGAPGPEAHTASTLGAAEPMDVDEASGLLRVSCFTLLSRLERVAAPQLRRGLAHVPISSQSPAAGGGDEPTPVRHSPVDAAAGLAAQVHARPLPAGAMVNDRLVHEGHPQHAQQPHDLRRGVRAPAAPQAARKYMCRKCGVPKKGHTCTW